MPVPGLARVAALAPPIDLEHCAKLLALPGNRMYERHFVRDLIAQQLPLVQVLSLPTPVVSRRAEPGQGLMLLGDVFRQALDKRRKP